MKGLVKKVVIPLKLVLEFPIYRKPTKKLNQLIEQLAQLRIGSVQYETDKHLFRFRSSFSTPSFSISDNYFKNPKTNEVEFERFRKFRSALNLIIAVTSCDETNVNISIIECPNEITTQTGIYANLTLTVSSTSINQFKKITDHLSLLDLS